MSRIGEARIEVRKAYGRQSIVKTGATPVPVTLTAKRIKTPLRTFARDTGAEIVPAHMYGYRSYVCRVLAYRVVHGEWVELAKGAS